MLGLVIAEKLHALFPDEPEGSLALKYNALVRGEACAAAALMVGLSDHLILAAAEAGSGGRKKNVILAGAIEAVIAALYLDGGMEVARQFIERYWVTAWDNLSHDMRDAKTALQEWAQGPQARQLGVEGLPVYKQVGRDGPDHAPHFAVQVLIKGHAPQTGHGSSKREAEQDAARLMLNSLGLS